LKTLAKELHVAVVLAAQMNRQSVDPKTGKSRTPVLSDLGESGALEADADAVLFLHRPDEDDGTVDVVVAKNRSGTCGLVPLCFIGHQVRLGS
jgi:replicative DNA helicase